MPKGWKTWGVARVGACGGDDPGELRLEEVKSGRSRPLGREASPPAARRGVERERAGLRRARRPLRSDAGDSPHAGRGGATLDQNFPFAPLMLSHNVLRRRSSRAAAIPRASTTTRASVRGCGVRYRRTRQARGDAAGLAHLSVRPGHSAGAARRNAVARPSKRRSRPLGAVRRTGLAARGSPGRPDLHGAAQPIGTRSGGYGAVSRAASRRTWSPRRG